MRRIRPAALLALATLATVAAGTAPGAAGATSGAARISVAGGASDGAIPLLLINGTRLLAGPAGGHTLAAAQPPGQFALLITFFGCTQRSVVPAAALPYLGRGLDPSLFSLSALERAETAGRLPVRVSYRGVLPALPGITITRSGNGLADGYLTSASARLFGAALNRQFLADHARGSYGGRGLFANAVSIALAGAPGVPGPGAQPSFPMHTLTVTGTNLAGKPDTGDSVLVFNVDNCARLDPLSASNVFFHGVAKFSVPAGHYWAIGEFFSFSHGRFAARLAVLPQFSVDQDATVHVSARSATSRIAFSTPRSATLGDSSIALARSSRASTLGILWLAAGLSLWVSPVSRPPTVGTLQAYTSGQLISPRGPGIPYTYNLDFVAPPGTIPSQHFVARPADLATVQEHYFQDVPSDGFWATVGGTHAQFLSVGVAGNFFPIRLPARQVQYLSASPPMIWSTAVAASPSGAGGQSGAFQLFHRGQRVAVDWNRYPLHPGPNASLPGAAIFPVLPSASRAGNTLTLDITPFSDNELGHLGTGFSGPLPGHLHFPTGHFALFENGIKIASGNAATASHHFPDLFLQANLSPRPSVIKFVLTASRASQGFVLSAASRDVWTWRSRQEPGVTVPPPWVCGITLSRRCAVQGMLVPRYQVAGLSLAGATSPGTQRIDLAVTHLQHARLSPIARLRLQVSINGGRTWRNASVHRRGASRFVAFFTAAAGQLVTLRLSARDRAGDAVTETVLRAYRTSG